MSAFIKLRPGDIINTTYRMYPSQKDVVLSEGGASVPTSLPYYLETDEAFSPGSTRDMFDGDGGYITGSYNLTGTIDFVLNAGITNSEKRVINRLRNIYASSSFVRHNNYSSSSVFSASTVEGQYMSILNIPSVLYGSEIKPFSFKLSGSATLTDDGHGGILSNSVVVGSLFYQHGIALLGHNFQVHDGYSDWTLNFSGTHTIPMTMYICNAPKGMLNYSRNNSFTIYCTSSNRYEITTSENKTFITTIGLYDENYELLAIAKVAKPILNEEDGGVQFRLKINY